MFRTYSYGFDTEIFGYIKQSTREMIVLALFIISICIAAWLNWTYWDVIVGALKETFTVQSVVERSSADFAIRIGTHSLANPWMWVGFWTPLVVSATVIFMLHTITDGICDDLESMTRIDFENVFYAIMYLLVIGSLYTIVAWVFVNPYGIIWGPFDRVARFLFWPLPYVNIFVFVSATFYIAFLFTYFGLTIPLVFAAGVIGFTLLLVRRVRGPRPKGRDYFGPDKIDYAIMKTLACISLVIAFVLVVFGIVGVWMGVALAVLGIVFFIGLFLAFSIPPHPLTPFVNKILSGGVINGRKLAEMLGKSVRGGATGRKWSRDLAELHKRLEASPLYKGLPTEEQRRWREIGRVVDAGYSRQDAELAWGTLALSDKLFAMEVERVRRVERAHAQSQWIKARKLQAKVPEYEILQAYVDQALPPGFGDSDRRRSARHPGYPPELSRESIIQVSSSWAATKVNLILDEEVDQALRTIHAARRRWEEVQRKRKARMH